MEKTQTNAPYYAVVKTEAGYLHEQEADENTNSDKLGVYEVKEIGYGFLTRQDFSIKDRLICVYHGKKIPRKKAFAKKTYQTRL